MPVEQERVVSVLVPCAWAWECQSAFSRENHDLGVLLHTLTNQQTRHFLPHHTATKHGDVSPKTGPSPYLLSTGKEAWFLAHMAKHSSLPGRRKITHLPRRQFHLHETFITPLVMLFSTLFRSIACCWRCSGTCSPRCVCAGQRHTSVAFHNGTCSCATTASMTCTSWLSTPVISSSSNDRAGSPSPQAQVG